MDLTDKYPIGKFPKCEGKIFETDSSYICERSQAEKRPCKFKVSRNILQRKIEVPQVQKMLQGGKTDLLDNFISKSGKPFSAYLVMDDDGKVTFDFPPREEQQTK